MDMDEYAKYLEEVREDHEPLPEPPGCAGTPEEYDFDDWALI